MSKGATESGPTFEHDPDVELGLLTTLVRDAPVGIAFLDREYRYRLINRKLAELNDVPIGEHIGRTVAEVLPHIWPRLKPVYDEVLQTGRAVTDVPISGRVGSSSEQRHWLAGYYPVRDGGGRVTGIGVVIAETTEQVRAEQEVRRLVEQERAARESILMSESQLRAILAAIPDYIFHLSADGTHLDFFAPQQSELYATPDAFVGRRVRDVLPEDVAERYEDAIRRTLETGRIQVFEYDLDYAGDDRRVFDARMVPRSEGEVMVIVRDVTEVKVLEEQLRHAQKMDAIGQLAGGVAHDFNNLLTVINGYAEMLETIADAGPAAELVGEIRKAGDRAAALTRQLLLFSRQQRVEPRVISLNGVVAQAERMLTRLLGANVFLTTDLDADVPAIRADPGQIEQVLVNLAVNARDAMPQGGKLTVTTSVEHIVLGLEPSSWVRMSVSDTGTGMEPHVRDHIFEPFFTTKPPGQGTGLGLSVVFGVVKECGGSIEVESEPGRGSTFTLRFPAVQESATQDATAATAAMPRGLETILVVEDESAVRRLAVRTLAPCGYTVLEAADGASALDLVTSSSRAIHLIVSDVVMPHMNGNELRQRVQAIRPEIEFLMMSGYHQDVALEQAAAEDELSFLQKPFSPVALATRVRDLLDRSARRRGQAPPA